MTFFTPSKRMLWMIAAVCSVTPFVVAPSVFAADTDHFVTTWNTNNAGTSNSMSITIPTTGSGYSYQVDWNNDGDFTDVNTYGNAVDEATVYTDDVTFDFGAVGTYTIRIQGDFPRIYFNIGGDKDKILSVDQWGTIAWTSFERAFYGASNIVVDATDTPNLAGVTNMRYGFTNATNLGNGSGNWDWNTATITNMQSLFSGATDFNKDISSWDMSNVLTTAFMFNGAASFNQDISNWERTSSTMANVSTFLRMFRGATVFNQNINNWDVSGSNNFSFIFNSATSFNQDLSSWDVSSGVNFQSAFYSATNFNQDISSWNVASGTTFSFMFSSATNFDQPLGDWSMNSAQNLSYMFNGASSFDQDLSGWERDPGTLDISDPGSTIANVTTLSHIFRNATSFNQDIGGWDTGSSLSLRNAFANATNFNQDIGGWDTSSTTDMYGTFNVATSFDQDISSWNVESVTDMSRMIYGGAGLSTVHYDALLSAWDSQSLMSGVTFDAGNSTYCEEETARTNIETDDSWDISDSGLDCAPDMPVVSPDLQAASDSGSLSTDNITVTTTPVFDIVCREIGNTLTVYTNNPSDETTIATHACTSVGTVSVTSSVLAAGMHNITYIETATLKATPNVSEVSPTLSLVIDTDAPFTPSISVDTMAIGIDDPMVTFVAVDNIGIDYYEIEYIADNNAGGVDVVSTTISTSTTSTTLDLDPDQLLHTIIIRAFDYAGNSTESIVKFPPVITFLNPTIFDYSPASTTVMITSPAGNNLTNIALMDLGSTGALLDCGVGPTYPSSTLCTISGMFTSGDITITAEDVTTGAEGENSQYMIVDTVDPVIQITTSTKTSASTITDTSIRITDNHGIASSTVSTSMINTSDGMTISAIDCVQTTAVQVDCSLSITATDGVGDLYVQVVDYAGNIVSSTEAGYSIDTEVPTVESTSITIDDIGCTGTSNTCIPGDVVTFLWNNTSGGDNNLDIVSVTADLSAFGLSSSAALTDTGAGAYAVSTTLAAGSIDDDMISITVTAVDDMGNTTGPITSDNTVSADTEAPTLTAGAINIDDSDCSGTGGICIVGDVVIVTWDNTSSTDNNLDPTTISIPGTNLLAPSSTFLLLDSGLAPDDAIDDVYSVSVTITAGLVDALASSIAITVLDDAGNETGPVTSSATVMLDNSAPTVTEVTAVETPTGDSTPSYTFSSTAAGTLTVSGGCSSVSTAAVVGVNTITLSNAGSALSSVTYGSCSLQVVDSSSNTTTLAISSFTISSSGGWFIPPTAPRASGTSGNSSIVTINNNTVSTDTRVVTVSISAENATSMAISLDPTFADASFVPYQELSPFVLGPETGMQTVYVKLRSDEGGTLALSDSIIYTTGETIEIEYPKMTRCTPHTYQSLVGMIVKSPESPRVFYVGTCYIHWFENESVYLDTFSWNDMSIVTQQTIDLFTEGVPLYDADRSNQVYPTVCVRPPAFAYPLGIPFKNDTNPKIYIIPAGSQEAGACTRRHIGDEASYHFLFDTFVETFNVIPNQVLETVEEGRNIHL